MDLLEKVLNSETEEELNEIISNAIEEANNNSTKIETLGFEGTIANNFFKGFIPFDTRIAYEKFLLLRYSMKTTDFFYEHANFLKQYNIKTKGIMIKSLETFINMYFGIPGINDRNQIFEEITISAEDAQTDEEYFEIIESITLGDLKGKNAAMCTERAALAQQILSLYGFESYFCIGCVDNQNHEEPHAFNIVKRKNDYALVDYSIPVSSYLEDGKVMYLPFVGEMPNEEFEKFKQTGTLKTFRNYQYVNNEKEYLDDERAYVIGEYEIQKDQGNSR